MIPEDDAQWLVPGIDDGFTFTVKGQPTPVPPNDNDACPKVIGKTESSAHQEHNPNWKLLARFPADGEWIADGWNTITGTLIVDQPIVDGGSTEGYFECKTVYASDGNGDTSQVLMVIDDVSIRLDYWPHTIVV